MLGERRDVRELERRLELRPRAGSVARVKQRLARAHARECSPPTAPTSRQSRAASTRCARPRGSSDHALGSAQSRGSGCAVRTIAFIRPRRVARSRRRHLAIAREMATVSANALGRCEAAPSRPKGRPGLARIEQALPPTGSPSDTARNERRALSRAPRRATTCSRPLPTVCGLCGCRRSGAPAHAPNRESSSARPCSDRSVRIDRRAPWRRG